MCATEDFQSHSVRLHHHSLLGLSHSPTDRIPQELYVDSPDTESALLSIRGGGDELSDSHTSHESATDQSLSLSHSASDDFLDEATEDPNVRKQLRPLLDVISSALSGKKRK